MKCNICNRDPGSPFRVYDERGKVIHGCVGESHTGHLVTPSESARFHSRPEAKKIRAALHKMRYGKGPLKKNPRKRINARKAQAAVYGRNPRIKHAGGTVTKFVRQFAVQRSTDKNKWQEVGAFYQREMAFFTARALAKGSKYFYRVIKR